MRIELVKNQSSAEKNVKPPILSPIKAKEHIEKFTKLLKEICTEVNGSILMIESAKDQEENTRLINEELFVFEQWIDELTDQHIKKDADCQAQTTAILGLYDNFTKTL